MGAMYQLDTTPPPLAPSTYALTRLVVQAAQDAKAEELTVIDITGRTSYCDVLVLCTCDNSRHVRAIAGQLADAVWAARKLRPLGTEGLQTARWVLLDFGDVVVHIFDDVSRRYYDLDGLWLDAPQLDPDAFVDNSRVESADTESADTESADTESADSSSDDSGSDATAS